MQESCHLLALDKLFSQKFPLFIVWLSILSHSHPIWCLECRTKTSHIPLPWSSHFLFFSFFFSKLSLIIINTCPSSTSWTSSCSNNWNGPPYLIHLLRSKVSPMFHQLSKTKLGLLPRWSPHAKEGSYRTKQHDKLSAACRQWPRALDSRRWLQVKLCVRERRLWWLYRHYHALRVGTSSCKSAFVMS